MKIEHSSNDYDLCLQAWMFIMANLIPEVNPNTILEFTKLIVERASFICHSQSRKFEGAYPEEMLDLLPKFNNDWVRRFSHII